MTKAGDQGQKREFTVHVRELPEGGVQLWCDSVMRYRVTSPDLRTGVKLIKERVLDLALGTGWRESGKPDDLATFIVVEE